MNVYYRKIMKQNQIQNAKTTIIIITGKKMLQIHIFDNKILQSTDVCNEIDIFACLRTKSKTNFCFQFFFFPDLIYKFHYLKYNRFLLMVSFQTFWYIFFFAFAYVTRSHHTFAIICPEWAFFFQIYFVKAKIVTNQ